MDTINQKSQTHEEKIKKHLIMYEGWTCDSASDLPLGAQPGPAELDHGILIKNIKLRWTICSRASNDTNMPK